MTSLEVADGRSRPDSGRSGPVCVVGLGYVGVPLAHEFDRAGFDVIGYDIDSPKVDRLREGTDPTGDVGDRRIRAGDVSFTDDESSISRASFVVVAVPTPVDELENPDLESVRRAGETVGRNVAPGTIVVLESTVYPGATREVLIPAIDRTTDHEVGEEVRVGYSPERVVPGDESRGIRDVTRIVSARRKDALEEIAAVYEAVVDADVYRAPSIEVAEAAKCVENVQRDLNIALVNELAIACEHLDLDTEAVLDAASTKWNFHEYRPGIVGGHCIPVDPFFIISESRRNGFTPKLIQQARAVNEYVPKHVAELTLKSMNECRHVPRETTVLVLGLSYKPGVGDVRTSAVDGTISHLRTYDVDVVGYDPHVDSEVAAAELGIEVREEPSYEGVDGIVLATAHEELRSLDYRAVASELSPNPFLVDVDGALDADEMREIGFEYRRL